MYMCMYVCIYIYTYIHMYVCISISLYIYIYTHTYTYTYICIHTYVYIYIYIYIIIFLETVDFGMRTFLTSRKSCFDLLKAPRPFSSLEGTGQTGGALSHTLRPRSRSDGAVQMFSSGSTRLICYRVDFYFISLVSFCYSMRRSICWSFGSQQRMLSHASNGGYFKA